MGKRFAGIFLLAMIMAFSSLLYGCEDTTDLGDTMIRFEEQKVLKVSSGEPVDLTEGLIATCEYGLLKITVVDDGGYAAGKLGTLDVVCRATHKNASKDYTRKVYVDYYGIAPETLGMKAPSGAASWTFRNTVPVQTGAEWSRYVVEGHDPQWNRFEESSGLVMFGSDTAGRNSTVETEDDAPNTILYNRFTFASSVKKMRVYLSTNPYPDYNNQSVRYRFSVYTFDDGTLTRLQDWQELVSPLPTSGAIDTGWYQKLQYETYVDLDVSAYAGEEVVFLIEQDSSPNVYQKELYKAMGYSNKDAQAVIKETRDALVVYDVVIFDDSEVIPGLRAEDWSAMPVDEHKSWEFSKYATPWNCLPDEDAGAEVKMTDDGMAIQGWRDEDMISVYHKLYMMGDTIKIIASGDQYRVRAILPNREVINLSTKNDGWCTPSLSGEEYDLSAYVSQVITLVIDVYGGSSVVLKGVELINKNAEILWTIGDSLFHTAPDVVSEIAASIDSALVTSNLSGTTISPCRMVDECMVELIRNGTFDMLLKDVEPTTIIVERGLNDLYEYAVNHSIELGDISSTDPDRTIMGAVNFCMDYLQQKFPDARIVWMIPSWSAAVPQSAIEEYAVLLKEICQSRGVECLDMYTLSGINKDNYSMYLYDGTHMNETGKKVFAECWINCLAEME